MILYLQNKVKSENSKKFVCHYTKLDAAIAIIKSMFWYLGNAEDMNDNSETQHFANMWSNIFYTCFMTEQTESIAMWSMYAQPWEDGVMLRIPMDRFKKWVKK